MAQASNYPYCNLTTDLQMAFKDIENFARTDTLTGFELVSGQQSTLLKRNTGYYGAVYENGVSMSVQTSIALVEANAQSFYYDSTNDILYIHPKNVTTTTSISSLTSKVITHSLGYYPITKAYNSSGVEVGFEVTHDSTSQFTGVFAVAQSGNIVYSNYSNNYSIGGAVTSKTIVHNLGYEPIVQVFDLNGKVVDFELDDESTTQFTCTFAVAQDGTIITTRSMTDDDFNITAGVDDWNGLKTTMRNDAMEIIESLLDTDYPRPLPFAATSYNSGKYDFDIRHSCALMTCQLIIAHRDPRNALVDFLYKKVWNPIEDTGILWGYHVHRKAFSFETTKDEFLGNVEVILIDTTSTARMFIAGNPQADLRREYRVKITTGGAVETAKFQFSDDGGLNYGTSNAWTTYGNWFHLVNDIWIRFEGTMVANDEWSIVVADEDLEHVQSNVGSMQIVVH